MLCWIRDLGAWMSGAAGALRPGGRLVLVDVHPLYQVFASREPLVADRAVRRRRRATRSCRPRPTPTRTWR
ncbi:hypothetical protein ACU686_40170 [Yinghuangia aomiensis]